MLSVLRCCKIASKKQGRFLECLGAALSGSNNIFLKNPPHLEKDRKWVVFHMGIPRKNREK